MAAVRSWPHDKDSTALSSRRELALLIGLCRRVICGDEPIRSGELAAFRTIDWDEFVRLADLHGLGSLAASQLQDVEPGPPAPIQQWLRDRSRETFTRQMLLTATLKHIAEALGSDGVPVIAVKGPILAGQLYGDRALREYMDLDIVVPREKVPAARRLLALQGFRSDLEMDEPESSVMARASRQISFHDGRGVAVDLHWSLHSGLFPDPVSGRGVWERLETVTLGGTELRTLGREDQLLYHCSHGSKHYWRRLCWLVDLARWLRLTPSVDWEVVAERATSAHCERMIEVSLELADRFFGVKTPSLFGGIDSASWRLATAVEEWVCRPTSEIDTVQAAKWTWTLLPRFADRWRYLWGILVAPTVAEWRAFPLPRGLHILYYPLRTARLAHKYGGKVATRILGGVSSRFHEE